jgi:AcrR family transcriptional regulator
MTPRPYDDHNRKRTADAGRDRILAAARDILNLDDVRSFAGCRGGAGVTRMTVYNQFGSKSQLLVELFGHFIERDASARCWITETTSARPSICWSRSSDALYTTTAR